MCTYRQSSTQSTVEMGKAITTQMRGLARHSITVEDNKTCRVRTAARNPVAMAKTIVTSLEATEEVTGGKRGGNWRNKRRHYWRNKRREQTKSW